MKTKHVMIAVLMSGGLLLSSCEKEKEPDALAANKELATASGGSQIMSVLFNGDASNGTSNVWKTTNIEGTGAVTTVNDETGTLVWKFLKPSGSHRTECRGAKNYSAQEGDEIYIGWTSKIYMPTDLKTDALFQWKSYPTDGSDQNHPFMVRTKNGKLELQHFDINHVASVPWSTTLSTSTWLKFVIRMKVSRDKTVGFIEFWYNGVKQTLSNGSDRLYCRTLDTVPECDPKWGVYGGDTAQVTHFVKKIRIGTTYADAAQ
ncbi:heparin lyase I family protein [Pedobacter caeni]|uniref:Polysaccharide lyase n=1 Tax=Pedobacter caeni TaxID=288992 RepID=A0A1M5IV42_9SPHI|nr:heparin lyase I family protein [Pedobacter caeni]SHG31643.1 Polysaccharide lyase [Pedobacter caeni]